jgi:hypothetical protein
MDEVNIPRTFSDAGWPPQPSPESPGPGAAGDVRAHRLGTRARVAIGLTAAVVLAGVSVLSATLSSSGAGTAQAAGAVLTGSASPAGGSPHGSSHGAASGAFGAGASSGDEPWAMAHGARARIHACIASARRLRASGHNDAARARLRACFRRFFRHREAVFGRMRAREARLGLRHRAMHGQFTIESKSGPKTIAFERGTVESASGSSVVIKAADGVTMTWQLGSDARIYRDWHKVSADALAAGQQVAVMGLVTGGSDQARRVLIWDHTPSRS